MFQIFVQSGWGRTFYISTFVLDTMPIFYLMFVSQGVYRFVLSFQEWYTCHFKRNRYDLSVWDNILNETGIISACKITF